MAKFLEEAIVSVLDQCEINAFYLQGKKIELILVDVVVMTIV